MFSRYGVVPVALVEGIAAAKSLQREPAALDSPVFVDGFVGVGGAGWPESANRGRVGRDVLLVEADEREEQFFHKGHLADFGVHQLQCIVILSEAVRSTAKPKDLSVRFFDSSATRSE